MQSNHGRWVPPTRTARATPAQPRHTSRSQATPNQVRDARHEIPPPPEEPEERRRSREAGMRRRGAPETRRPGQNHPGRTKQQEPPPPGLEQARTRGGQAPMNAATGADQAGGAAATPDWIIQGQVVADAPDWNIRGGASSRSLRRPDWSIQRQVAEDAPDRINMGKTRRRGENPQDANSREKGPDAQGKIVAGAAPGPWPGPEATQRRTPERSTEAWQRMRPRRCRAA